jgi:hypothetical protein
MFILIDKNSKTAYLSKSKKMIAKKSGYNYHTLSYYLRGRNFYENMHIIFCKPEILKSNQGGKRIKRSEN